MNWRRIFFIVGVLIILFLIIAGIHWLVTKHRVVLPANAPGTTLAGKGPIIIVLSPDFGDAALSLGGLLAQHARPALVVTFFTGEPSPAVTTSWDQAAGFTDSTIAGNVRTVENQAGLNALGAVPENYGYVSQQYSGADDTGTLESNIAQDIQTLLVANTSRQVYIYGPADFGTTLTSADDQVVHDAFTDAVSDFPSANVHFFYYETYPAVAAFNTSSVISVEKFLDNELDSFVTPNTISLSTAQVGAKISAIKKYQSLVQAYTKNGQDIIGTDQAYTSTRCGTSACEVVYQTQ